MLAFLLKFTITTLSVLILNVNSQIPSFGGCPKLDPIQEFQKDKFLGLWYEAERLFTITELASKCVSVLYEKRPDGKTWIDNFVTNRFTGVERKISGTMKQLAKNGEATYGIQYNSLPINYETILHVLDTDYDNYAVIYSCSEIGPFGHTQNVWLMTRERIPPGPVLQQAYGVLDKYRIGRTFFIKTIQTDCEIKPPAQEAYDPANNSNNASIVEVQQQP